MDQQSAQQSPIGSVPPPNPLQTPNMPPVQPGMPVAGMPPSGVNNPLENPVMPAAPLQQPAQPVMPPMPSGVAPSSLPNQQPQVPAGSPPNLHAASDHHEGNHHNTKLFIALVLVTGVLLGGMVYFSLSQESTSPTVSAVPTRTPVEKKAVVVSPTPTIEVKNTATDDMQLEKDAGEIDKSIQTLDNDINESVSGLSDKADNLVE